MSRTTTAVDLDLALTTKNVYKRRQLGWKELANNKRGTLNNRPLMNFWPRT